MYKNKKILAVITARGGSKGIPRKNIKELAGKPLIEYTVNVAKKSKVITDLILSTDDQEIADICKNLGVDVPFLRPSKLANDKATHLEVMRHALQFMEEKYKVKFDYTIILQPTSPFRLVEDIDNTIKKMIDLGSDSAVSITEIEENHPIKIKKFENDRVSSFCFEEKEGTRRQDLPIAYKRSGAVYAMKRDLIINENKLYGDFVAGYVIPNERSIDIDNPRDWILAKYMLKELKEKGYEI
jgi:CMP-N-acetylneuraminic acid synthetase